MRVNTLLKVLEQLLHKIKANRRREMGILLEEKIILYILKSKYFCQRMMNTYYLIINSKYSIKYSYICELSYYIVVQNKTAVVLK